VPLHGGGGLKAPTPSESPLPELASPPAVHRRGARGAPGEGVGAVIVSRRRSEGGGGGEGARPLPRGVPKLPGRGRGRPGGNPEWRTGTHPGGPGRGLKTGGWGEGSFGRSEEGEVLLAGYVQALAALEGVDVVGAMRECLHISDCNVQLRGARTLREAARAHPGRAGRAGGSRGCESTRGVPAVP